jgi:TolB protein
LQTDPGFRMEVHRMSDEIARWASGTPGMAASRLLLVSDGRVYRIDSDGHDLTPLTPGGATALSPVWSPDGQRFAYTRLGAGKGQIMVQTLGSGAAFPVPGTEAALNITPAFSPDGRTLAYAHSDERGTDVYVANIAERCCARRLTVGRFADNLSPTYSPDGRRLAFISTRAGPPQVYAMAADGTDQELLAPFDYGATGSSNAPEWSPDGANVVFHREVSRSPQIFTVDAAGRRVRQLTSSGRNEDPTWAPDGRHVAFVSDRSGRRQIWVIDIETGTVRQLGTPGAARLPAWSRRLGRPTLAAAP